MSSRIKDIRSLEVLDSRGFPTIRTWVELNDGTTGMATVPSGASTGENEAVELRDGDTSRFNGKGVLKAIENVEHQIAPALRGLDVIGQEILDRTMIDLDGTPNKSRLGANAILSVSMAAAVAAAKCEGFPLYRYLDRDYGMRLPVPMMNILNGGKHADNRVDFQEFMIMPVGATSFSEALQYGADVFHALKGILRKKGYATSVGDEGGFAPDLKSNDEACDLIVEAIGKVGLRPGADVAIALDPAATSFFKDGKYELQASNGKLLTADELLSIYQDWVQRYPIVSIEDGFEENDWKAFVAQTCLQGGHTQIVGDDLYVTNTKFIQKGIDKDASNAVLIKLNQIGTVTETIEAIDMCRSAGWNYIVSHRSGETEDTFLADFTVAMGGGQIKTGSLSRSERIAKYNRLLEIEHELGGKANFPTGILKAWEKGLAHA